MLKPLNKHFFRYLKERTRVYEFLLPKMKTKSHVGRDADESKTNSPHIFYLLTTKHHKLLDVILDGT